MLLLMRRKALIIILPKEKVRKNPKTRFLSKKPILRGEKENGETVSGGF